ncbi:hypothetical protein RCG67_13990 [Kocuria sp. CPCC 205292]|uniref:hypothetical protein n=1 Tax=Kocuria cellulosilytica TaxID=3071451 RepID=UPI0034D60AA2
MTTTAADHTGRHQHSTPHEQTAPALVAPVLAAPMASAPTRTPGSRLDPGEDFPEDLTGLGMADLQVLHSRITRQLDHDYLTDPAGPRPATMDRSFEVAAELDARDTA